MCSSTARKVFWLVNHTVFTTRSLWPSFSLRWAKILSPVSCLSTSYSAMPVTSLVCATLLDASRHRITGARPLFPFVLAWTLAKKRNNAKGKRKEKKNKRTIRCHGNFGSKYTFWVRDVDDTYWMFNVQGPVVHLLFNELTNARQDYLIYSRNVLIERSAS